MDDRQASKRTKKVPRPLDAAKLEELALAYVARFATSAMKVERYLQRKVRERGWAGDEEPEIRALVRRFVERGYIDDAAYARAKSSDLLRRGYGARRVNQALGQAGIGESVRSDVAPEEAAKRRAAIHMARKRGFGPFAPAPVDRDKREKQIAAMLRAGHTFDHVRFILDTAEEQAVDRWLAEVEEDGDDFVA